MAVIRNPILPGFNPDPSICRVGDDYFIAPSTFEWFPDVQIHHSRDLVNWHAFQHAAGLTAYYNRTKFHCLAVGWDENLGRSLTVLSCKGDYPEGRLSFALDAPIAVGGDGPVRLAASVDHASLQFAYALDREWRRVDPVLDASILSEEAGGGEHRSFTGAFVGMVAFGAAGGAISADFRHFDYAGGAPEEPAPQDQ